MVHFAVVVVLSLLLVASVIGNISQRRKLQVFDPALAWIGIPGGAATEWKSRYYDVSGERRTLTGSLVFGGAAGVVRNIVLTQEKGSYLTDRERREKGLAIPTFNE